MVHYDASSNLPSCEVRVVPSRNVLILQMMVFLMGGQKFFKNVDIKTTFCCAIFSTHVLVILDFFTLTLFCAESEYPYHVRGGAPEATPCISGTIHQKVTKLLEQTYVGKCRGFKA